jgi:eukaryotic-like serine/threonine-protein kinase
MVWDTGKELNKGMYTIEEVLHQGQLSVTYLTTTKVGDRFVIKTPNKDAIPKEDFDKLQERFVIEAFKLKDCQKSPYIVQVKDPFQEEGFWCLPMEYIDSRTLNLRNPLKLGEAEAVRYVRQIGQALEVVHAQGLIHRDVSPNNIMLRSPRGINEAVLIDFGLVRDFNLSTSVTSTQKVTPYTARELCLSKQDRGSFTDLYGLGAVLYSLVTGQAPPMATDRLPGQKLSFPSGLDLDPKTEAAIEHAMQLKGIDRPSSVAAWLQELPVFPKPTPMPSIIEEPTPIPSIIGTPGEPPKKRVDWTMVIAAIAAIGGLLGGIGALMQANKPSDSPPKATPTATSASPTAPVKSP